MFYTLWWVKESEGAGAARGASHFLRTAFVLSRKGFNNSAQGWPTQSRTTLGLRFKNPQR
jgi:hypothetical protein